MVIPYLQFRSKSIVQYNLQDRSGNSTSSIFRTEAQEKAAEKLKESKTYSGMVTNCSRKRLTKAIEFMITAAPEKKILMDNGSYLKFRINFITLTISCTSKMVKGKEAHKQLLEPFLLWLKRKHGCKMYLWKAELQERGQLHYHLMTDCYVPWRWIRDKWNALQKENGYLEDYYYGYDEESGQQRYSYDANSTDVHSIYKEKDLVGYVKKEIFKYIKKIGSELGKDIQNKQTIEGKIWDCSLNIKQARYYATEVDSMTDYRFNNAIVKRATNVIRTDNCFIYEFDRNPAWFVLGKESLKEYLKMLDDVRNYERKPPKPKIMTGVSIKKEVINFKPQLSLFSLS